MMPHSTIGGVIPAILTPRGVDGVLAERFQLRLMEHALESGAAGLCINGATGEYSSATPEERRASLNRARAVAGREGLVVAGLGAATWQQTVALGADASEVGADMALVPVPHFFRYGQAEIAEYYTQMAATLAMPALIYNLPAFTGGLETETAVALIGGVEKIVGIKDSSGRLETLEALSAQEGRPAVRLVGHDGVLVQAFRRDWAQGTISGVACVLPELTVAVYRASQAGQTELLERLDSHLTALIRWIEQWPTPWALKVVAGHRGFGEDQYSLPLSAARKQMIAEAGPMLETWFTQAQGDLEAVLGKSVSWKVK